jgi:hypothetical protein
MVAMFECPDCGGLLEYPITYDISGKGISTIKTKSFDKNDFTMICDWCTHRIEIPLEPPDNRATNLLASIDKQMEGSYVDDQWKPWPRTWWGKIMLCFIALTIILSEVLWVIGTISYLFQ